MWGKKSKEETPLPIKEKIKKYKEQYKRESLYYSIYLLRIILAIFVAISLLQPERVITTVLFLITLGLGFVDYIRYRKKLLKTPVESIFNTFGDKLLIILVSIMFFTQSLIPLWAFLIFIAKDGLSILRDGYLFMTYKSTIFKPSVVTKITLYAQSLFFVVVLFDKPDQVLLWTASILTLINIVYALFSPEVKIVKKATPFHDFAFRKLLKPADLFTLANVLSGIIAVIFAISNNLTIALVFLLVSVVCDVLDGKVARATKTESEFGKELDSLADTVSFGVAPAVIGFTLIQSRLAIIAFSIFLLCGILRLAKFNIMQAQGVYIGMPITWNGIILPLLLFFSFPIIYLPYVFILLAILMVAPVQVKKR